MIIFIIIIIFFIFIFKLFNKFLIQIIYQNILIFIFILILIYFPFNNLNIWCLIYYIFRVDFYSIILILLSVWILVLIVIVSIKIFNRINNIFYINLLNILIIFLIICFFSINLIIFYFFFESGLIPVFFIIIGWGSNIDRIQARIYIIMYTLVGSIPLFIVIIYLYVLEKTIIIDLIIITYFNLIIYLILILAFLIKIPIYIFHLWLPKAHVEAPIIGSIILAGVMLKLGRYGLIRVIIIIIDICLKFNKFIILFRLIGGIYSSLICLCQIDIKILVAYSSVVHIRLLISGIITLFTWGCIGSLILIISHGLCSSGLFCLVNIRYERLISRSLFINKGLLNYFPSLRLIWFFLCSSNLSFPPSLNLFGEIILLNSLIIWSKIIIFILILLLFFRASYSLYLYSFSQHGKINLLNYSFVSIKILEFLILLIHWIPLNLIFLWIFIFL